MRKALAAAALLAAGLLFWRLVPGGPLEVTLPAGVNAAQAGVLLRQDGVIFSATLFRLAARWSGEDRRLHAGTYRLRRRMRLGALLLALRDGSRSPGIRVAIPEGFASWQIAQRLEAAGVCKASAFLRYV
ncbi:MAG: endolytic transglycosylase MltG, partial [Elusimicrobia bacterium]|nr:endolytic transglycosylase MltG [Elusimicrobiota bacterium]